MKRALLICIVAAIVCAGCETMPWDKGEDLPPVELLDDEKGSAAPMAEPAPVAEPAPAPVAKSDEEALLAGPRRFKDIPLPQIAREDKDRTYIRETATSRNGNMVYNCRASVNGVAQFYIDECPAAGWKLDQVIQAQGVELRFDKGEERLVVVVRSQGVGRFTLLSLVLN